jgi:phosphoserine phosphatase RsbU/P
MSSAPISGAISARAPKSGMFPVLLYVHGAEQKEMQLGPMPFGIGRKTGKDLEIPDPRVSRDHAEIICEEGAYFVVDLGSKMGTFVNKQRVTKHKLTANDRIEFGVGVGAQLIFEPANDQSIVAREFLSQISSVKTEKANDLEKLALFLDAARKLNTQGALDEILITLIGTTLKLTNAERGFIFVRQPDGEMKLAAACTSKGERLTGNEAISHSIVMDASRGGSEFLITDTMKESEMASRQSIVAQSLKTVIAIPLRKAHGQEQGEEGVLGVLYMDSKFASGNLSSVSTDILKVIAREAAALHASGAGRRSQPPVSAGVRHRRADTTAPHGRDDPGVVLRQPEREERAL